MPLRVALNVAYAMLTAGLDSKERDRMDEQIYGWSEINDRASRALRMPAVEDEESGGES